MSDNDKLTTTDRVALGVGGALMTGVNLGISVITFGLWGLTGSTGQSVSMVKAALTGKKSDLGPDNGLRDTSDNY